MPASSSAAVAALPDGAGAASGAGSPGGQRALVDMAGAAFMELMAQTHGSAWRADGGKSSEICPRDDLRLPPPPPPAEGELQDGREGTAKVQKEALCPTQALCLSKEASSPQKEALRPLQKAFAHHPSTVQMRPEVAASAAAPVGDADSARVAGARSPINAAEDRGGHRVAADCGEPWHQESRKMAADLGSALTAPELHPALGCTPFEELSNAEDEADAHDPQEDFQSSEQDVQEDFKASEQNALQVAPELDFFKNRCAFLITELKEVVRAQG